MMRKKWSVRLLLPGICLVCFPCLLMSCRQEEDAAFFSEEILMQQSTSQTWDTREAEVAEEILICEPAGEEIMVYVCGAVKNPGVFALPAGSRVNDALQAAGGFTENAACNSINLAAKLADEEMIYVPTLEEVEAQNAMDAEEDAVSDSMVNINTADLYGLCRLPGIGESKAREIIAYREEKGPFRKKEDVMQVTGIKESLYRKICDLISVK